MLTGKKTYIIAALMFIVGGLKATGYLDESNYQLAMSLLVPGGLVSLRLGMNR